MFKGTELENQWQGQNLSSTPCSGVWKQPLLAILRSGEQFQNPAGDGKGRRGSLPSVWAVFAQHTPRGAKGGDSGV